MAEEDNVPLLKETVRCDVQGHWPLVGSTQSDSPFLDATGDPSSAGYWPECGG